jgi:hypothetical protein
VVGVDALVAGNGGQRQGDDVGSHGGQQAPPPLAGAGTPDALDSEPLGRAANRDTGPLPWGAHTRRTTGSQPN